MTFASNDSVKTMKCVRPRVLIADIAFTENRFPMRRTTGVVPLAPQVRPVTWSERIPTWSPKGTSPFSAFALARMVGQVSSCQTRTASASCSTARLSGRWKVRPQRLRYLPHPGLGEADPVQLEDQLAYLPPRPQLTGKPQAGGDVIEDSLPHSSLLGLGQHLVLTRATASRPGQQRVPAPGLPLRPPVVHGPGRHHEQGTILHPVPALHQRGHRQQPHSLLCVRRPRPRIPHQIAHTPSTSMKPKRFGSIVGMRCNHCADNSRKMARSCSVWL